MRCLSYLIKVLFLLQIVACHSMVNDRDQIVKGRATLPEIKLKSMSETERLLVISRLRSEPALPYTFGLGDVLRVSVYDEPDLNVDAIPVRPDGMISFPLIGDVRVKDKTVNHVRMEITDRLGFFLVEPKVSVMVRKYSSQQYTILGEIVHPGVFTLDTELTITQAIARSGGLTTGQFHASSIELADLSHAFISRKGEVLPVDFSALLHGGDLRYDLPLRPGDYIYIPSGLVREVFVLGEVHRPDLFAIGDGMRLSKALVIANGTTREADLKRIHIVRESLTDPELYIVNMHDIFAGKAPDVILEAGDVVFVPSTGLSRWSDIVNKIIPGLVLARTGSSITQSR